MLLGQRVRGDWHPFCASSEEDIWISQKALETNAAGSMLYLIWLLNEWRFFWIFGGVYRCPRPIILSNHNCSDLRIHKWNKIRGRNGEGDRCSWNDWTKNEDKKETRQRKSHVCEKWMVRDGMNEAVSCESLGESHWEKSLRKKVPHISHQGVLWAQEPWLLLGMAWEWWGKRNPRTPGLHVGYWVSASLLHIISTDFFIQAPQTMELPVVAICCEAGRQRRGSGNQYSSLQFESLFFGHSVILEPKMKGRNTGVADSGSGSQYYHMLDIYWSPTTYQSLIHLTSNP